jgi:hypothetical protein
MKYMKYTRNGNGFLSPARAQILEDPEDYPQICIQPVAGHHGMWHRFKEL